MFRSTRTTTLLLLLLVAALQQVRYLRKAVLPAQDAVDVVSVAQRMERDGLAATVRAEPVPPLFPALVARWHSLSVRLGRISPHDWVAPLQEVAAMALLAAVVPIFLTAERLGGRATAVVATIGFIALHTTARLGADGLADAVHLLGFAAALWFTLVACEKQRSRDWLAAGVMISLALLCRAEAVVLPLAAALLFAGHTEFRRPSFFAGASLCLAFFAACGIVQPNDVLERLRGGASPTEERPLNALDGVAGDGLLLSETTRPDLATLTFGHKDRTISTRARGFVERTKEFYGEFFQAFAGVLLPCAAVGFFVRRRTGFSSFDRLMLTTVGLHLAIVAGMTLRNGYLSTRHFVVPIVGVLPYVGLGVVAICRRLATLQLGRLRSSEFGWQCATTLGFVAASLVVTSPPLHGAHEAHRRAAAWLQAAAPTNGAILDQRGWTALYTGLPTYRFDAAEQALADPRLAYVVVERADLEAASPRGASLRTVLGSAESAVAAFAAERNDRRRDVLIFSPRPPALAMRENSDAR